jgi:hypothetical protein
VGAEAVNGWVQLAAWCCDGLRAGASWDGSHIRRRIRALESKRSCCRHDLCPQCELSVGLKVWWTRARLWPRKACRPGH